MRFQAINPVRVHVARTIAASRHLAAAWTLGPPLEGDVYYARRGGKLAADQPLLARRPSRLRKLAQRLGLAR